MEPMPTAPMAPAPEAPKPTPRAPKAAWYAMFALVGLLVGAPVGYVLHVAPVSSPAVVPAAPTPQPDFANQLADLQARQAATQDALNATRVRLAVMDREVLYGSRISSDGVYQDPLDKNTFVWLGSAGSGPDFNMPAVEMYDLSKDADFAKTGKANVWPPSGAWKFVYSEKIAKDATWYTEGMDGSKFIIWQTSVDNSPGPCANVFLDDPKGLTAVDIAATPPTREPYTPSPEKVAEARADVAACQQQMQSGETP